MKHHNHREFEIVAYHNHRKHDDVTRAIRQYADHWRPIAGVSDEKVAQLVRNDKIDILVDLSGHTAHNRLLVFARKAAPVQVTWIGYPASTGLQAIDYRIADETTDPSGESGNYHSEHLIRLPDCFLVYQGPSGIPDVGKLPALKNGYITFGSFNNMAKTHKGVLSLWSDILSVLPESRLILKCQGLEIGSTRPFVHDVFSSHNIARHRVDLLGTDASSAQHMQRYNDIDIGLDPFPYNGTTTTCEAAMMGVPVITLKGNRHAGRVGASLLHNMGLDECVAKDPDDYVSVSVQLARDVERLSRIRSGLRTSMQASPLMNAGRFTASLENEFRKMWEQWCFATENHDQEV